VTAFQQPLVSEPGIPAELALVSLSPITVIAPKSTSQGVPLNLTLTRPYNNLGVPGATSVNCITTTTGGFHDLVLRGLGTAVQQAVASKPTYITLWIGNNDVLGAVVRGTAVDGVTLTPPADFRSAYGQIVADLRSTGGALIVGTIPDVTQIPYATTIPPYVVNPATRQPVLVGGNPVPLLGPSGPLSPGTYVTLAASTLLSRGVGVPTSLGGTGLPLPGEVILDQAEVATIQDRVNVNNQAIRDIAQANGATVLDMHAVFADFEANGRNVGGVALTAEFLTGGFFGYDGIHPTDLGYAIVANEWITAIAATGLVTLPPVNLAPFLGITSASSSSVGGAFVSAHSVRRPPPFEFTAEAQQQLLALFPTLDGR
jgi:lysophospholipase L1-like esterase